MRSAALLLLALSWACGQGIQCSNNADTETKSVSGPDRTSAILHIHTEDDHAKNSHGCEARFTILLLPPRGAPATSFYQSDGEWGRRVTGHPDGFSVDGKHLFGIISETGRYSSVVAFDYDISTRHSEIVQIHDGLTNLEAVKCGTSFAIAGTSTDHTVVLQPNTAENCRTAHLWLLGRDGRLRELPAGRRIVRLYKPAP